MLGFPFMKILYSSNCSKQKTGFGRHAREFLSALHMKGYEVVEYAAQLKLHDSKCASFPWKCYGNLPDNDLEIKQFLLSAGSEQERAARAAAVKYGVLNIDHVINEERPDLIIFCEDIWGITPFMQKPWWNKIPCIVWTPIDSLPILDVFSEQKDKLTNLWVKAPFAANALNEKGIPAKLMPGLINENKFFKISEDLRQVMRENCGLTDSDKIIGFNFRNQSRKLVDPLIKALREYKDSTGDENIKLFLHTNFTEPGQWDIPKIVNEYGLHKDVFCTYICSSCRSISIENFKGQKNDCPVCNAEKSVNNPVPEMGVSEEDLNCIYGMMDGYCHLSNSGGFEFPVLEAILSEIPTATIGYSYGETFTENENIFNIDYILDREIKAGFYKAHPKTESIIEFFNYVKNLPENINETLSQTRKWFVERYGVENIINEAINIIDTFKDSVPDYSFFEKTLEQNDKYEFIDYEDNVEFLKSLYINILNSEPVIDSDQFKSILDQLNDGLSHEKVYNDFIESAKTHNESLNKSKIEQYLLNNGKKRLLYIMPESLGDCFVSLSVIEGIMNTYPNDIWDFYVATKPNNFVIFEHLNLAGILPYERWMDNYKSLEGSGDFKGYFDIAFHPYFLTQRAVSYHHNGLDIDKLQ